MNQYKVWLESTEYIPQAAEVAWYEKVITASTAEEARDIFIVTTHCIPVGYKGNIIIQEIPKYPLPVKFHYRDERQL